MGPDGTARPRLIGWGHAVPSSIRRNDDPVFAWLHEHPPPNRDLFAGYRERRVLAPGERLEDLAEAAARAALADADLASDRVDVLLGYVSVADYVDPNALALLHQRLGLPAHALIVPINNEFNNFNSGVLLADALLRSTAAARALVVCAGGWTRAVDYHTAQSVSAGDGAGAAVLGPGGGPGAGDHFALVDSETLVDSKAYGSMFLAGAAVHEGEDCDVAPRDCTVTRPFFQITDAGAGYFREFGEHAPAEAAQRLLDRNGLSGGDITLVSHQASSVLMEAWEKAIGPAHYINTIETFANMTVATIPVNVAVARASIRTEHLLLLGIGVEMQTLALLLRRG